MCRKNGVRINQLRRGLHGKRSHHDPHNVMIGRAGGHSQQHRQPCAPSHGPGVKIAARGAKS
eukprot:6211837-Pleurochrysis_carterae.AAC.2